MISFQQQNKESAGKLVEDEEVDIDLQDPKVEKAALKIQAGFKNLKSRKRADAAPKVRLPAICNIPLADGGVVEGLQSLPPTVRGGYMYTRSSSGSAL